MTVGSGLWLNQSETNQYKINFAIRQLMEGRSNAVGTFTLVSSSTSTVVTSVTASPSSVIVWQPTTPNAASQMATLFCTQISSTGITLNHANNANNDQTFNYIVIG